MPSAEIAACTNGTQCQASICIPNASGSGGTCTAPCVTNADCPSAAPMCVDLAYGRPSGATQPGRGCVRM